jgi:hypothetical protein
MSKRYKAKRRERYWAETWRCPWCGACNRHGFEGLDECDGCGSYAKTRYDTWNKLGPMAVFDAEEPLDDEPLENAFGPFEYGY